MAARIDPIIRDIAVILSELTPDAQKKTFAAAARSALLEVQEVNRQALGRVPTHKTFVDGREGAALETVSANGTVVFAFDLYEGVFAWIAELLEANAPVLAGDFQRSFILLADGIEVPLKVNPPEAAEYVFTNVQPYARKIERGLSRKAPDGVFEAVATMARRRFGNVMTIRFGYREIQSGVLDRWAALRRPSRTGRSRRQRQAALKRDRRQPAIILTPR